MGAWLKNFYGMNVIVPSLIIGLSAFVAVSLLTPPPPADVIDTFWGE